MKKISWSSFQWYAMCHGHMEFFTPATTIYYIDYEHNLHFPSIDKSFSDNYHCSPYLSNNETTFVYAVNESKYLIIQNDKNVQFVCVFFFFGYSNNSLL